MHSFHLVFNTIIPVSKNDSSKLWKYSLTETWTFLFDENFVLPKCFFRFGERWKSNGAKSEEQAV